MTEHRHRTYVDGCYRCELSRDEAEEVDPNYGYCNSCGEEMWIGDECCDDGEWVPADEVTNP